LGREDRNLGTATPKNETRKNPQVRKEVKARKNRTESVEWSRVVCQRAEGKEQLRIRDGELRKIFGENGRKVSWPVHHPEAPLERT